MSITSRIIATSPFRVGEKSRPTYRVLCVTASVGRRGVGSGARRGRPAAGVVAGLLPPLLVALVARAKGLAHALQALESVGELAGRLARPAARADGGGRAQVEPP